MATDQEVTDFISHFGKKGMKWGTRGTARIQKRLDRNIRVAAGKGSLKDNLLRSAITKKGINRQLQRGADHQAKINAGQRRVQNRLAIISGVRINKLDFGRKGDANAKMDNGQKAALGYIAAVGAISLASAAARR